ncbi:MAG: hypothetical protein ACKVQW_14875 [Pyrinomonadaceae bacterium]
MKNPIVYIGIIFIFAANMFGQEQKQRTLALDSGTRIDGQLQSSVDVKKSRVGDQVVLKTTKDIKQDGRTVVPKGSKLLGRVTEVTQKSKQNGGSRLGMVFDRLEGKNLSAPISATIVSVTSAAANAGVNSDMANADVFGSSSSSTQTATSGSGGGLLGGVTGTAGSVLGATTQTVGGVTNTVGNTVGNTAGSLGKTVNGIQISSSTNASAQSGSTLSARDKNIRLEKGTTIGLQVSNSARVN